MIYYTPMKIPCAFLVALLTVGLQAGEQLPIYLWDVLERDPSSPHIAPLLENGHEPKIRPEFPVDRETPPAFLPRRNEDGTF